MVCAQHERELVGCVGCTSWGMRVGLSPDTNSSEHCLCLAKGRALSNSWLKAQGLVSVKDLWCKAQGYTT